MPDDFDLGIASDQLLVGDAISKGAKALPDSNSPRLDARVLLKFALQTDDAGLIGRSRERLSEQEIERFAHLIRRRQKGEPVAYITGVKEFWSLEFAVDQSVLIPREDSECLIETVIARRQQTENLRIADLGTGSGCLICALISEFPQAQGVAVDLSPGAVKTARTNAAKNALADRIEILEGSWTEPLRGQFDVIIANPPYISDEEAKELSADVIDYEPSSALLGGDDGLDPYRVILREINDKLTSDGLLVFECGYRQTDALAQLVRDFNGNNPVFTINDLSGRPRGVGLDRRKGQKKD